MRRLCVYIVRTTRGTCAEPYDAPMGARLRRAIPSRLDILIALLLTVFAQGELVYIHEFTPLAAALSAVITIAVAWRRVGPVPSTVLVITVYGLQALVLDPPPELLG